MPNIYLDIETYSTVDLKKQGLYLYTLDCEVLMLCWCFESGEVTDRHFDQLVKYCAQDDITFIAHNAAFERLALTHGDSFDLHPDLQEAFASVPLERWRCSMAKAASAGLPMSLDNCSNALGATVELQKLESGKNLIKLFCVPQKDDSRVMPQDAPAEWEQFTEYCKRDVEVCRWVWQTAPARNYDEHPTELALWHLDQRINDRGVPVDTVAVRKVIKLLNRRVKQMSKEVTELTGGSVTALTQVQRIHEWIREGYGVKLPDLQGFTIEQTLKHPRIQQGKYAPVRRVLQLRQQGSKASNAKYAAMLNTAPDNRVHHVIQYCGASRTGRWAGRLVQPHNYPRPTIDYAESVIEDVLSDDFYTLYDDEDIAFLASEMLRGMFLAPDGYRFVVADLSQIEARVFTWLSDNTVKLEKMRQGVDIYKELAAKELFRKPIEMVTPEERFSAKVGELACQYQGHAKAVCKMARNYGAVLTEDQGADIANAWRRANEQAENLWRTYEEAFKQALRDRNPVKAGHCTFATIGDYLVVKAPSGGYLHYMHPEVTYRGLRFMGQDSLTKQWCRLDTYGGKLAQNICERVARDTLARGMMRVEKRGYEVVLTVHDEIVSLVPEDSDLDEHRMVKIVADPPAWLKGCPLAADGYTAKRYRK